MTSVFDQIARLSASMRVVLLVGKELYLRSAATARLVEVLTEANGEVGRFRFDGETAELSAVLDEVRSYGLLQRHKLVIVDDADLFVAVDGRRPLLEKYARNPAPESTLLMRATTWRPGRIDKLVSAKIKCDAVSDKEAVGWCLGGGGRIGPKIERPAAELLVERLGTGLARLESELEKLAAYVGPERAIRRDDVVELVGRGRQEQAWALQKAIVSGSPAAAVAKLRELLEISQLPRELAMWANTDLLRRMHTTAQLLQRGVNPRSEKQLRLFGPEGESIIQAARHFGPEPIAQLLRYAVETDLRSKSGFGRADRNLEALTVIVTDTIGCR